MSIRFIQRLCLTIACLALMACEDSDVRLGREALRANDPDKALNFFSIAAERNRADPNVKGFIAQALARKNNIFEASRWMRDAHSLGLSGSAAAKLLVEEAAFSLGADTQKSITLYTLAADYDKSIAGTTAVLLLNTADGSLSNQFGRALELYDAAVKLDPKLAVKAAKTLSTAALSKLPLETDTALTLYSRAVKYDDTLSKVTSESIYSFAVQKLDANTREALRHISIAADYDQTRKSSFGDFLSGKAIEALKSDNVERAELLMRNAMRHKPEVAKPISDAALARAKELASSSDNWQKIAMLARFVPHKGPDTRVWGPLLQDLVNDLASRATGAKDLTDLARLSVAFDDSRPPFLAKTLVKVGSSTLDRSDYDLDAARLLYDTAIDLDAAIRAVVIEEVWKQFVRRLFTPGQFTKESFLSFFEMTSRLGIPSKEAGSVAPYSWALKEYFVGTRSSALTAFAQIAQNRPNSREGRAAAAILAPPRPRVFRQGSHSFVFNSATFWTQSTIEIKLLTAEVSRGEIELSFRLKHNSGAPATLVYQKENYDRGALGGKCEKLHVIDDNGTKLYALNGFVGGVQESAVGDCYQHIKVGVGEEWIVSARFPMISSGATNVKFVSNAVPGGQGDWWWGNIQVKSGPFEIDPGERRDADGPMRQPAASPDGPVASIPPKPATSSTAQPSFNCGSATTVVEKTICDNGDLALLDQRLGRLYRAKYDALNEKDRQELVREQRAFIADRNVRCGRDTGPRIMTCLTTSIEERIRQLGAAPVQPSPRSNPPPVARPAAAPPQSGTSCFMFNGRQVCE